MLLRYFHELLEEHEIARGIVSCSLRASDVGGGIHLRNLKTLFSHVVSTLFLTERSPIINQLDVSKLVRRADNGDYPEHLVDKSLCDFL